MTQTTLTGDKSGSGDESDEQTDAATESTSSSSGASTDGSNGFAYLAPAEQRGGDGCCPWCLASPETFVERRNGRVGCGYCSASIPVGIDWYENGEKIAVSAEP